MMKRYKGVNSRRLKGWDYSSPGIYFITICTKNRRHFFGEIRNGIVGLTRPGCIAYEYWSQIPEHYPHVRLDEFIIMPNHLHGIIEIKHRYKKQRKKHVESLNPTPLHHSPSKDLSNKMSKISPKSGSISEIIRSYKGSVTRWCNKNKYKGFAWQYRFHDRIIRHRISLPHYRKYIQKNPLKWDQNKI